MNKYLKTAVCIASIVAIQTGCTKIPPEAIPSAEMVYKEEDVSTYFADQSTTASQEDTDASEKTSVTTTEVTTAATTEETAKAYENSTGSIPAAAPTITAASNSIAETDAEPKPMQNISVHVESISLSKNDVKIYVGKSDMPIVTMSPYNADDKSEIWTSSNSTVASVDAKGNITGVSAGNCKVKVASASDPSVSQEINVTVQALPDAGSAVVGSDGATYINGILIVNKSYSLPSDYAPGVNQEALDAFNQMQYDVGVNEGLVIYISSDYRSYDYQKRLYERYLKYDGAEYADAYSARPGYSEHQTGLAFDLNTITLSFGDTAAGKWVAENCYEYGFIIRYPEGKEDITGFSYEPWHIRYVGKELAKELHDSGLTLEEYLGIDSVYDEKEYTPES